MAADKELDALIVEVCAPIFTQLVPLQTPEAADQAPDDLRALVEKSFVMLERRCFECQVSPEHIRDLKYAMAAFADEVVLNSRWEHKYDWMARPLAVDFFGDSAIGQNFFNRLQQLREKPEENSAILQLYFSVLSLGFQGKYRLEGYDQLQAYISTFRIELEQLTSGVSRILADNAAPETQLRSRIAGQQSYWVMGVLFVAAVLSMTLVYSSKTQQAITASATSIKQLSLPERSLPETVDDVSETEETTL